MKVLSLMLFLSLSSITLIGQVQPQQKGKFYFYWGWNKSVYSNSTIHFKGNDYSFRLENVKATDKQSRVSLDYINPSKMTIAQYNFRIGYYFKENWSISFGNDHMKYVVTQGQQVEITGHIRSTETVYNSDYNHNKIEIKEDFLKFEHTDGLNYENIELRHFSNLKPLGNWNINLIEGFGLGISLPKTNSTLLGKARNDEFHLAGYGANVVAALQLTHNKGFFMQAETKGGFINMPDILTSPESVDRARQNFFFFQYNLVFGYQFSLTKKAAFNSNL